MADKAAAEAAAVNVRPRWTRVWGDEHEAAAVCGNTNNSQSVIVEEDVVDEAVADEDVADKAASQAKPLPD